MPHPANDDLDISATGVGLVARFEGFRPDWYRDAVGVWTIGFGTTEAVEGVSRAKIDAPISRKRGRTFLRRGLRAAEQCVHHIANVPLQQSQYDALVSWVYNVGCRAAEGSTLRRRLAERRYTGAADELLRWVWAGGKRLDGLVRRRKAERALFLRGPDQARATRLPDVTPAQAGIQPLGEQDFQSMIAGLSIEPAPQKRDPQKSDPSG